MRGTFGNIRLRNRLVEGKEGPYTLHLPDGEETFIYDAAMRYRDEGVPLVVLAGKEYGSGSSRDWAAKGTTLLGRPRRDRRDLRADPPLQPRRDGRAAAPVPARRERGEPGAHRPRGVHDRRAGRAGPAPGGDGRRPVRRGRLGAGRSAPPPGSTGRSRSTTCARAGSCRRSCGGSPRTDPGSDGARPPGEPGASLTAPCGSGRRRPGLQARVRGLDAPIPERVTRRPATVFSLRRPRRRRGAAAGVGRPAPRRRSRPPSRTRTAPRRASTTRCRPSRRPRP